MKKILLIWLLSVLVAGVNASAVERSLVLDRAFSKVEVSVKATVDSFVAKLPVYEVNIRLDDSGSRVVAVTFHFHFSDIKTGKADRDEQMNVWQETSRYPDGEFTLISLTPLADGSYQIVGGLRLHGMEHQITFPVFITSDQTLFAVDGEARFDTREFGLPVIRKFALLKVDPLVAVRFHLQGSVERR